MYYLVTKYEGFAAIKNRLILPQPLFICNISPEVDLKRQIAEKFPPTEGYPFYETDKMYLYVLQFGDIKEANKFMNLLLDIHSDESMILDEYHLLIETLPKAFEVILTPTDFGGFDNTLITVAIDIATYGGSVSELKGLSRHVHLKTSFNLLGEQWSFIKSGDDYVIEGHKSGQIVSLYTFNK